MKEHEMLIQKAVTGLNGTIKFLNETEKEGMQFYVSVLESLREALIWTFIPGFEELNVLLCTIAFNLLNDPFNMSTRFFEASLLLSPAEVREQYYKTSPVEFSINGMGNEIVKEFEEKGGDEH